MAQFTPTNQKRLTNVSVVKMMARTAKKRLRFEVACYPNKVVAWRQKLESNINEVLQSDLIYFNVSKAEIASKESLIEAFKTSDKVAVAKIILEKGELQLTEKERQQQSESLIKDLSKIVAGKTLNPDSKSCFTPGVIEKMLKDCHINLKMNKSAKQQSLDAIRFLKKNSDIPIDLALFSVTITVSLKNLKVVKKELLNFTENVVNETKRQEDVIIEAIFEPGNYDQFKENCGDKCGIELTKILDVTDEKHKADIEADEASIRNESDAESHESEKITSKKSRRRAKNKGGDVTNDAPVEKAKEEMASSDEDNNNPRRKGKKRGNKK